MPRFVVVGHRAATAPTFKLDDLPGTGGRLDILARCVGAALLVSHGTRPGCALTLVLLGPPTPPRAVRFTADRARHLNPDERSTASLVARALGTPLTAHVWQEATPGVQVAKRDLARVLDEELQGGRPLIVLDEQGADARAADLPADGVYVLGDHEGLTADERALLAARGARAVSVGPTSLQADQAIVVLHNELDRRGLTSGRER